MARRRTRAQQPVDQEEEHIQEEPQEPEPEPEVEPELQSDSEPEPEPESAPRVVNADDNDEEEQRSLQFNEELSWRPAKPIPSGTLLTRLERLSKELADFDQGATDLDSLKDVAAKLAHRNLLQHKDRGVKAYTACCLVDILRLFVPDAPFTDEQLKVSEPPIADAQLPAFTY